MSNSSDHQLSYNKPAGDWLEALPVGNGQLGAMVYGDPICDRIQITEKSIWAGPPVPEVPVTAKEGIDEARNLIFDGKYTDAQDVISEKVLGPSHVPRSQQSLGDLKVQFHGRRVRTKLFGADARLNIDNLLNYTRNLDLRTAVATASWQYLEQDQLSEVFCSVENDVVVVRYKSSEPGSIICSISLSRESGANVHSINDNTLVLQGRASHRGKQLGVSFASTLRVQIIGGTCVSDYSSLEISGADEVVVFLAVSTDYNINNPLSPLENDLVQTSTDSVNRAIKKGYEKLLAEHLKSHHALYSKVELDLGASPLTDSCLDERRASMVAGKSDSSLEVLQFNYGRYLLINSSRPGSLPANLQGVWNYEFATPWNSDYHTNINMQMNYWLAESCGLGECHEPFFDFMEKLLPQARKSAEAIGCRGAFLGVSTDVWQYTAFYGHYKYGMWVMGLAWCSRHFMERYQYTGDIDFLENRTFPILKECSLFLIDWLVKDPETGKLVSGPSTSPENEYYTPEREAACLSMGCSMDQEIVWDCFNNTLEAAQILSKKDVWLEEVKQAFENLAKPEIGTDGRLKEWSKEFEEVDPGHRHISHLYGLHPSRQFNLKDTPEYIEAIKKTIETRLSNSSGGVGWSSVWISLFYSRLKDGDRSYQSLSHFTKKLVVANLFGIGPVYQIDCNLGYTAAVCEMLLQCNSNSIEVLPALPSVWAKGSVKGLRAQGGFEIDIHWESHVLTEVSVISKLGKSMRLDYKNIECEVNLKAGESLNVKFNDGKFL